MIRKTGWIVLIALLLTCAARCRVCAQASQTPPSGSGTHIYDNVTQILAVSYNDIQLVIIVESVAPQGSGTHIYDSVPLAFLLPVLTGLPAVPAVFDVW